MMTDTGIFGLRFRSNEKIHPSGEELKLFLESPKTGSKGLQGDDLAKYRELLTGLDGHKADSQGQDFSEKMLYTVLARSHFVRPELKSTIEQYKYHFHALETLDFNKPAAFIKSAEAEMARLNPKKKDEAQRLERMRVMVEERKRSIEAQNRRWKDLAGELDHILAYISENLGRIADLCEQSIGSLVGEQIDRKKEAGLIEDIKTHFKERLRDSLHQGTISKADLENAKEEVAVLSKKTADLLRSDVFTMTQLYEAIHDHARKLMTELGGAAAELKGKNHARYEDDLELYRRAEKLLISLVSDCRLDVKAVSMPGDTAHQELLADKRKEIFAHLVELLPKTL